MNASETMETEEDLLTCLHIKLFHPRQSYMAVYGGLPLKDRIRHSADEPLKFGRDSQACTYTLSDPRVSRKQLALHAYRTPRSPDMLFSIQNLSQKGRLLVNNSSLGYLERMDLPEKVLIRIGDYEMLITWESGEAKASFEVEFEILSVSLTKDTCPCVPTTTPVMDTGSGFPDGNPAELMSSGPLEMDETLACFS
ncbi:TRAF-interacting protein with FHA domain-containing protein A [Cynoglossus semilaevis]|nr:TRAF-interacting protein with FHA domain-containing protein A [Cynoglossus semilaevis]